MVAARVDETGHEDEWHGNEQSPEPSEFDEIGVEKVGLVGEVRRLVNKIEVLHERADDEGEKVDADLDVRGRENETTQDEHDAHVEKAERCRAIILDITL